MHKLLSLLTRADLLDHGLMLTPDPSKPCYTSFYPSASLLASLVMLYDHASTPGRCKVFPAMGVVTREMGKDRSLAGHTLHLLFACQLSNLC